MIGILTLHRVIPVPAARYKLNIASRKVAARRLRQILLGPPSFSDSDIREIKSSISTVLKSGWLTSGPLGREFERRFLTLAGTKFVIAMNSGTASLHVIAAALDLKPSDEVVVPANTFASTANAILYVGARPVPADCDIDSFNVTAETLEERITRRTKAVIVTHVGGNPCEMSPIVSLCRNRGLALVEDAAHAVGATHRGRKCGSFGWASAFSFYPTKIITSGEGGAVGTNSKRLRDFARLFRNVGRVAFGSGPIVTLGYNYRMSDIHAAIGLNQLSHIRSFVDKRNRLAVIYDELLSRIEWVSPQLIADHSRSTYYTYIVRLLRRAPVSREKLSRRLRAMGVETTVMFRPVHRQPYFRGRLRGRTRLPNAETVGRETLALPMHPALTDSDVEFVVKAIRESG